MKKGEIIAFVISPLTPVAIFSICLFLYSYFISTMEVTLSKALKATASFAIVELIICYIFIILFALPFYVFAKAKKGYLNKALVLNSSSIIGAILMSIVGLLFGADEILEYLPFTLIGIFLGFTAGLSFWLLLPKSLTIQSRPPAKSAGLDAA